MAGSVRLKAKWRIAFAKHRGRYIESVSVWEALIYS